MRVSIFLFVTVGAGTACSSSGGDNVASTHTAGAGAAGGNTAGGASGTGGAPMGGTSQGASGGASSTAGSGGNTVGVGAGGTDGGTSGGAGTSGDSGSGGSAGLGPCEGIGTWMSLPNVLDPDGSSFRFRRFAFDAIWTGSQAVFWGGGVFSNLPAVVASLDDGLLLDPDNLQWSSVTKPPAPFPPSQGASTVWTGTALLRWGGGDENGPAGDTHVYSFDPVADTWSTGPMDGAPTPRWLGSSVWTGGALVVWGGNRWDNAPLNAGAFDVATQTWTAIPTGPLSRRAYHTAVWTGNSVLIWGGGEPYFFSASAFNDGARYDPASQQWSPMSSTGAPSPRFGHVGVWTGSTLLVWGGTAQLAKHDAIQPLVKAPIFGDGSSYDPVTDTWTPMSASGAPTPRAFATAAWTGTRLFVWGGYVGPNDDDTVADGALYDPASNTWTPVSHCGAPDSHAHGGALWTGKQIIVLGGETKEPGSLFTLPLVTEYVKHRPSVPTSMASSATRSGRFVPERWVATRVPGNVEAESASLTPGSSSSALISITATRKLGRTKMLKLIPRRAFTAALLTIAAGAGG